MEPLSKQKNGGSIAFFPDMDTASHVRFIYLVFVP